MAEKLIVIGIALAKGLCFAIGIVLIGTAIMYGAYMGIIATFFWPEIMVKILLFILGGCAALIMRKVVIWLRNSK